MDISPYLRKPLRSLQEVVETLKPASAPETAPAIMLVQPATRLNRVKSIMAVW